MKIKDFTYGMFVMLCFVACAGLFPYKHYGLSLAQYTNGKLLGPDPKEDLDISVCAPDAQIKGKCVVMLSNDFFSMKSDFEQTKQALIDCQKP